MLRLCFPVVLGMALISGIAQAAEYPIGSPATQQGMEVGAVFLQPIEMDPPGMMRAVADADIHLEADLHAAAGNPNGFEEGAWIPNLGVEYVLVKTDTKERFSGHLMPMVASDGPHYGDNVKLAGPGNYVLTLTIAPPNGHGEGHFGRHVDKETGVAPWFKPFDLTYEFVFAGIGKKGGY
jgi:uncharacterized protein involved in high-affinity Fe2+ transport